MCVCEVVAREITPSTNPLIIVTTIIFTQSHWGNLLQAQFSSKSVFLLNSFCPLLLSLFFYLASHFSNLGLSTPFEIIGTFITSIFSFIHMQQYVYECHELDNLIFSFRYFIFLFHVKSACASFRNYDNVLFFSPFFWTVLKKKKKRKKMHWVLANLSSFVLVDPDKCRLDCGNPYNFNLVRLYLAPFFANRSSPSIDRRCHINRRRKKKRRKPSLLRDL